MEKIAFVGTGGTIAWLGATRLDLIDYTDTNRVLDIAALLGRVAEINEICHPVPVSFAQVASMSIGPDEWIRLGECVMAALQQDIAGVVVTHGTASLEETAYFLDLAVDDERPVVLTGALRPISALGTDAALNLVGAAMVAAAPESRGMGCLVALGGQIHAARYATKLRTYSVEAFGSSNGGPIGEILGSRVRYFFSPRSRFRIAPRPPLARVDIVASYAGSDGFAIDAAVAQGARGIVVAGFGPGDVTARELDALRRARASGVEIVQASRTLSGSVATRSDIVREGFVAAGRLTPQKARILTMLALSAGITGSALQDAFDETA